MVAVEDVRKTERANGPATILAIGTANPSNYVDQTTYPDYYFRITNTEHEINLKNKFKRICDKSMIKKRHVHITEEMVKENPNMCSFTAASLNLRQDIVVAEVPKLGREAAEKAIKEWGQPLAKITHLIFCTTTGVNMPGADFQLMKLLGLHPSVKRFMMYQQGCAAGGTVLRMAKDLAENNAGARVLVVCSEITVICFQGPSEARADNLVGQALFGDGAAALIVGSDPVVGVECPLFQLVAAMQTVLPDCQESIRGHVRESGLDFHILGDVPNKICEHIETCLKEAFDPLGISDWNSLFWVAHPGGPAILNQIEEKVSLRPDKLRASRRVLSEYGNMLSACVLFVMNEIRKNSVKEGLGSTGEGLDWGVLFGFGPGITVETVVLRSAPIN